MLSLYTDQGDINNVTAQNNTFRDMAPTSYYGIQWVDTAAHTCNNDKFLNNTYMPNAPTAWYTNTPPRFECITTEPTTATLVPGNTFQKAHPRPTAPPTPSPPTTRSGQNNTVLDRQLLLKRAS